MNLVSLESLKIFCDVVRQKSFSRGAALNGVSQSAASQTVSQIEKRLGVRLIDRSSRPLTLTREGEIYYEECRELVDRYMALEARISRGTLETESRLTVASIYSVLLYMDQYVQRFLKRFPNPQIRFQYLHPDDVLESVVNEQADLGLLSFPKAIRGLMAIPWRDEPMVLVCSTKHPFARLTEVRVEQLDGADFVAFESGLAIRRHIDRFLRQQKVSVNVAMSFDNIEFIKRGIEASGGLSILPEPTVRKEVASRTLAIVSMPELDLVRTLSIIHRSKRTLTPAVSGFIQVLQEEKRYPPGAVQSVGGRGRRRTLPGAGWR